MSALDKVAREGLDRAAEEASAILGLNVCIHKPQDTASADCTRYTVELRTTSKPVKSFGIRPYLNDLQAFTYIEGLVDGARVQRERHAALVAAAHKAYNLLAGVAPKLRMTDSVEALAVALAELERG